MPWQKSDISAKIKGQFTDVRQRGKYLMLMESKRCRKMHSKCEVQTLYSPGIAQDCIVTVNKVQNTK